ncbi:sugar-phosphatase [Clostridium sp. MSJ-8]|uniref:sugar-phosphatase n=1 Tax=Clostridium sp. MSJ-8 TaxID=2841510 RepID=UPI001C0EAF25|nr:sugar-phosphatase [Clostridium sp. MSJ-8]MBU5488061.1 sugar-phosphatase [Clostridium sp. MSJ-8]
MYKIIALDMDGTLLDDDKKITEENKKALMRAKDKGVKVVLSSGRPKDGLIKYLDELELIQDDEYVLSYNGCLVQEAKSGKILHEVGLKGTDLHYMYTLSREFNVNIHAFSEKYGLITPKMSKYTEVEASLNGIEPTIIDFFDIPDDENIIKIMLVDEAEILDEAISRLPQEAYDKYNIVKSTPYFLEIINKNGNKGEGLKALAEHLGVKREEVMAFGDASNDREMIEYAGLGVAMENAMEEIKEVADYITCNNNEDGVAKVINKFI